MTRRESRALLVISNNDKQNDHQIDRTELAKLHRRVKID